MWKLTEQSLILITQSFSKNTACDTCEEEVVSPAGVDVPKFSLIDGTLIELQDYVGKWL